MTDPTLQERLRAIASFKCGADKIQLIFCYSEAKDGCREAADRIEADAERSALLVLDSLKLTEALCTIRDRDARIAELEAEQERLTTIIEEGAP